MTEHKEKHEQRRPGIDVLRLDVRLERRFGKYDGAYSVQISDPTTDKGIYRCGITALYNYIGIEVYSKPEVLKSFIDVANRYGKPVLKGNDFFYELESDDDVMSFLSEFGTPHIIPGIIVYGIRSPGFDKSTIFFDWMTIEGDFNSLGLYREDITPISGTIDEVMRKDHK